KPFHEGPQSRFGHARDQLVEHAALAEERMSAMLGGVGLEMAVHAEAFSGGAEQRQENDREGVEEKQPVAVVGPRFAGRPSPCRSEGPSCRETRVRSSSAWRSN